MARSDRSRRVRAGAAPGRTNRRRGRAPVAGAPELEDRTEAGRRISGRAVALGVVIGVIVLVAAPSVNTLLSQEREILGLNRQIAEEQRQIAALEDEKARWDDPEYIKQRAREDHFYVSPGEQSYVVVGEGAQEGQPEAAPETVNLPEDHGRPWHEELVQSIIDAGSETP